MSHRFDPTSLREYDIRGIVGETLDDADAYAIGRSFGTLVRRRQGRCVAVAFDCGNLLPVVKKIRQKYRDIDIIVCGDNDKSGVGQKAANEAAGGDIKDEDEVLGETAESEAGTEEKMPGGKKQDEPKQSNVDVNK